MGMQDVYDSITETLQYVAPSFLGKRHLSPEFTPPRYVWVLTTEALDGVSNPNMNPRPLADRDVAVIVHCWHLSVNQAEHMRDALVTAARLDLQGQNYKLTSAMWTEPKDGECGIVLSQTIVFTLPLLEQDIPSAPADPPGTGGGVDKNLVPPIDNTAPEVTPEHFQTTATGTLSDGVLEVGEES